MNQKYIICSHAKGKRGCLLKGMTLICPRCCAEIRNSECEGCSYYKDSQKFAIEKAKKSPQHFTSCGVVHPDDASGVLIKKLWLKIKNETNHK